MVQNEWTAKDVRKMLTKVQRPADTDIPCQICRANGYITEAHHAIPVKKLAYHVNCCGLPLDELKTPIFWLCPNCHTYMHIAGATDEGDYNSMYKAATYMQKGGYPLQHIEAMLDLIKQANEAEDQLYEYEFELEEQGD